MKVQTATLKRIFITLWPAIFLAAVMLAAFFTTIIIHNRTFYAYPDNIDQFYAWYQKLAYAVHHGTLPIWDANVSAGHSFVGELQAGVFYPINILWVWLFGSIHGISVFWLELIVVFHFWLASVGMYLAGRSIGMGKAGSLASSLAYAIGGTVAMRSVSQTAIFFGMCLIPWVFFWFNSWLTTNNKRNLVGCAVTLGLIILAGHVNPWYFACLLLALLIVFRSPHPSFEPWLRTTVKRFAALLVVVAGSLIVALPQVVLSAQYLPHAVRFVGDAQPIESNQKVSLATFTKAFSFKPQDSLSLIDPVQYTVVDGNELYVGLVGLSVIAAVFVLCRSTLREYIVWRLYGCFLVGASAVAGIIMLGYWTFIPAVLRELPLFSQVRQLARYSVIIQFCLALLVGICVEVLAASMPTLLRTKKRMRLGLAAGGIACSFLALNTVYLYIASKHTLAVDKHFVYQNAALVVALAGCLLLRNRVKYALLAGMVLFAVAQPVWFMPRVSSFESTYPPNYYRRTPGVTYLEQSYGTGRVLIEDNALPVNIGDVYNIQTVGGYGATLHQTFYQYLNEPDRTGATGEHMDLLNVRYVVSKRPHPELTKVFTDHTRRISIYERPHYIPRAYFASDASHQPIAITTYSDTDIKLHYQTANAGKLVVSEVNYKGWKAYVDGRAVPITSYSPLPVRLFRSIPAPAGNHTVEFKYKPFGL